MTFKKLNIFIAWAVFAIALLTYSLTIEPTVSFWDCGEFITSSHKLEVGHPPGAPFFMIVAKVVSLFSFGNNELVARLINMVSALSSAFTILFLFWTITHIGKRILLYKKDTELIQAQQIAILGSGIVGALAYTFSDTFWFSAVEGEVYAMSSLFTAMVFWAVLKWENVAHEKYADRWLILIAYLMGLSIGVHLLNLLVIPAIGLIYYFKKYKTTPIGTISALGISAGLLLGMMYGIIPGIILFASKFELFFTNTVGMPYNSGTIIYALFLISILAFGLFITHKKAKPIFNTIILSITVIIIGYSSFTLILIRSKADTPMNQNKPNNVFSLQSYLNREQYGDRPLIYGEYFNAEVKDYKKGKPVYSQKNGKYEIIDHKTIVKFDPEYTTFFPRMYSDQQRHPNGYKTWAKLKNLSKKPSMAQNLRYFFNYQIDFMYFRYFMWNFAGKQNDIQGYGSELYGNWISGIAPLDNARLHEQKMPKFMKENKGRNTYFFLPLLLGIGGLVFMFRQNKASVQYSWAVLTFFLMTGLAIIIYLNQPPFQPRERDYAYAGSFYVFTIYIGLGVLGLYSWLKKYAKPQIIAIAVSVITLLAVPTLMATQNYNDHTRANRYTAIAIAKNYLNSCEPNAIIFTNGDNDTFPLWYAQEVEGVRTDIRVVNLSYLNTDWYVEQMQKKAYTSEPLPLSLTKDKYEQGTRDVIYSNPNPNQFFIEKYETNKEKYEPIYKQLFEELFVVLENSTFPELQKNDFEKLTKGYQNFGIIDFYSLINTVADEKLIAKFELDKQKVGELQVQSLKLVKDISEDYLDINVFFAFITDDSPQAKVMMGDEKMNYMPTTKISIPVDKAKVLSNGTVAQKDAHLILPKIEWDMKKDYITKSEIMIIDLLATNNWERPIYFAITVGDQYYMNLQSYFQLDGMAYRLVPIKHESSYMDKGRINTNVLYDNIVNKFEWGGINNPKVYLDETNMRMTLNMKSNFSRLAEALIAENKMDSAKIVLAKYSELMENPSIELSYYDLFLADNFYQINEIDKANTIITELAEMEKDKFIYYASLPESQQPLIENDKYRNLAIINQMIVSLRENNQTELDKKLSSEFVNILVTNSKIINKFNQMQSNQQELMTWFRSLNEEGQQVIQLYIFLMGEGE